MLDVNLLRSHYFRGPLTEEQQSELFAALRDNGIINIVYDLTRLGENYAYFITKSLFSESEIFTYYVTDQDRGRNIPSHLKEIKFEDLYIPEENMDFSWEAICELLGVDLNGSKP